jgi:hypothetical protein
MKMRSYLFFLSLLFISNGIISQSMDRYDLIYSTYLGGSEFEQARNMAVDSEGNFYVVGGTSSPDFPVTAGAYNTQYNNAGSSTVGRWGPMMVFVSKFSKDGILIWSTFIGGPNYDRAYAVEVDDEGYVYIGGRAGDDFPTTPGAFQEDFSLKYPTNRLYGHQNGFISKLSPDGSELIWSTYYGSDSYGFFRDIDIDDEGNVYGILNAVETLPNGIPPTAFDTDLNGDYDMVPVKFSSDGSQVIWAGVLGGSGRDSGGPSIRVGPDKTVYVAGGTLSSDFPTTPGAPQPTHGGNSDVFVTRISADGSEILYSTYLGGSQNEFSETHILEVDHLGQAHIACASNSNDVFTTPGVIQPVKAGNTDFDVLLAKYSINGDLLACSYFGGTNSEQPEGLYIDENGTFYAGGGTQSPDFPVTPSAIQSTHGGESDGFVIKLNSNFDTLYYSTFFGGSGEEAARAFHVTKDGHIGLSGQTISTDLPLTSNAFQSQHNNPTSRDSYLAILAPERISTNTEEWAHENHIRVFPNPAHLAFTIEAEWPIQCIQIFDLNGRLQTALTGNYSSMQIPVSMLNKGWYNLKVQTSQGTSNHKILIQ